MVLLLCAHVHIAAETWGLSTFYVCVCRAVLGIGSLAGESSCVAGSAFSVFTDKRFSTSKFYPSSYFRYTFSCIFFYAGIPREPGGQIEGKTEERQTAVTACCQAEATTSSGVVKSTLSTMCSLSHTHPFMYGSRHACCIIHDDVSTIKVRVLSFFTFIFVGYIDRWLVYHHHRRLRYNNQKRGLFDDAGADAPRGPFHPHAKERYS